jgi:hypothetical protein
MPGTLVLTKGFKTDIRPFDLSFEPASVPSLNLEELPLKGGVWLDYPAPRGYQSLQSLMDKGEFEQDLGQVILTRISELLSTIEQAGKQVGFNDYKSCNIASELLQNATHYGALSDEVKSAGLIGIEWNFEKRGEDPVLELAISNPVPNLFNPARYLNIPFEEFLECNERDGTNGHLATGNLVGYICEGEKLRFNWVLRDGGSIVCELSRIVEDEASAVGEEMGEAEINIDSLLMNPAKVEVFKYDQQGKAMDYSTDDFLRDITGKLKTETVTVAGVFSGKGPTD